MHANQLTEEQKKNIYESKLSNIELSKIYGKSSTYISKLRIKAGVGLGRGGFQKKEISIEEKKKIAKSDLTNKELSEKYKVTPEYISRIRSKFGTPRKTWTKENYNRQKNISPQKVEIKFHSEKVKLQASMSAEEQNYLLRKAAKESSKKQPLSDAEKIRLGTHKRCIISDRGIKAYVVRKIENLRGNEIILK